MYAQAGEESKEDTSASKKTKAPEGWLFEAESGETDISPDIEALLKEQAEQPESRQMGSTEDSVENKLEIESAMIFGSSDSPEDLQALPKVSMDRDICRVSHLVPALHRNALMNCALQTVLCYFGEWAYNKKGKRGRTLHDIIPPLIALPCRMIAYWMSGPGVVQERRDWP